MAEVVVEGVRKSFGRTEVLKGVSVAVADAIRGRISPV